MGHETGRVAKLGCVAEAVLGTVAQDTVGEKTPASVFDEGLV